jgi:putative ABC transport system ATP-binding protein
MALLLEEARRLGAATLLVTHDGEQAAGADREVRLRLGHVAPAVA